MTRLLIVGATGLVGEHVVMQALADRRISKVVALTRRLIPTSGKLENVVIDFSDMPDMADWWKVDGVVSALGTTRAQTRSPSAYRAIDYDYPLSVARHARDHGATHFALTSSLGANPRSRFAYIRNKGQLEMDLGKLCFPSLTIVRPSVLDGHRDQQRAEEHFAQIIAKIIAPVLPRRLRVSPASAVAALLIESTVAASAGVYIKTNKDMNEYRNRDPSRAAR
ncbi:NAD(P)H-binding protein [Lichenihabitans psoromatis]|uniref:NAD(P)H-binding protein n=1 Tax=Lichenihabitans psoromatis TaxID=2528642 RepID=UPI001036C658|nr:NAD(P)H-binding protein [Lichenihabitans psoromatis]